VQFITTFFSFSYRFCIIFFSFLLPQYQPRIQITGYHGIIYISNDSIGLICHIGVQFDPFPGSKYTSIPAGPYCPWRFGWKYPMKLKKISLHPENTPCCRLCHGKWNHEPNTKRFINFCIISSSFPELKDTRLSAYGA
jgi:hypothetical protein